MISFDISQKNANAMIFKGIAKTQRNLIGLCENI